MRLAHAIGFGMLMTRSLGMELPDPDSWHDVLGRVITSLGPDATDPSGTTDTTGQSPTTGEPA